MSDISTEGYLADEACRQAEVALHRLRRQHEDYLSPTQVRSVSKHRFRTLARRTADNGAPFGAHTLVYREDGDVLLVRHEGVDMWVVPGGGVDDGESFREAARRELGEEAGVEATYEGLALLTRVEYRTAGHDAWGVLPVFAARAETTDPEVSDPDDEISEARWFAELPPDTRDRDDIDTWRQRALSG